MFLERITSSEDFLGIGFARPLVVTKDSPRQALFRKLNRHGANSASLKKTKRREGLKRGNSFAGIMSVQRVVVKINPVKNKTKGIGVGAGSGAQNLYHHIQYINRNKAGKNGEKAQLFDDRSIDISRHEFFDLCKDDRHHFRMIISPENGHAIEDFQGYIREVMKLVQRDLKVELTWMATIHHDTDDVHAHVIIRGKDDRGNDLVIGRDYITYGIRSRAQEIATELLGERSLDEIQSALEKEVDALRVTSLDRFIDRNLQKDGTIDVRLDNNFGKSSHYESTLKGRLRYLASTGLAIESPPGVFALKNNYKDILSEIATRHDVLKKLNHRGLNNLQDLQLYSLKSKEAPIIEGRVIDMGLTDELTDRKYLVVESIQGGKHYIPVGEPFYYDQLQKGSLVRIRPFDHSSGRADFNIDLVARQFDGIYDIDKHREYIEKNQSYIDLDIREAYIQSHIKRIETLESHGAVTHIGSDRYEVPGDVISRGKEISALINEKEKKRFYPKIEILSQESPEKLTQAVKKTWLDQELYKRSKNSSQLIALDSNLENALVARQKWLISNNLAIHQSNGEFVLKKTALQDLTIMEVHAKGKDLAAKADLTFNPQMVTPGQNFVYLGSAELESGLWAVVIKDQNLQMAHVSRDITVEKGSIVTFEQNTRGRFKIKSVSPLKGKTLTADDQERELE